MVVAVGGNALTRSGQAGTGAEIEENADAMAEGIVAAASVGWRVVVVHGNGPQVGNLAIQQEGGVDLVPAQPLHALGAMTQGQLGSTLVRAIDARRGPGSAVALVSHVLVDPRDPAFGHPTKPIGPFFTAKQAAELARTRGWTMVEDSGRGHRRVVPSPQPITILESAAVKALLRAGKIVLAAGGGGVAVGPVFEGIDAVIDKDRAAARLAADVDAAALLLITGTEAVMLDYGTPRERAVHELTTDAAEALLAEGQFPPGSMGPKIEAALEFVHSAGGQAVVTSAEHLVAAVQPGASVGTRIVPSRQEALA